MAFRKFLEAPTMTLPDFARAAMDRPLSPWATFTGAAADAALQSPGLGTAIRESYAPDLAKEPTAGGKGGVLWRYESEGEVASRGDKLYETPEDFKASPSYREEIPFEKGMTESRARALADMSDASKVRQFYSSKRPVVAFAGSLAGSALDPINYIPIVGEVAYAAAAARVGRIASRALLTGADAALNTALFSTITAGQRAKFGDDVSWSAIAMNSAYSAIAGTAIGGTFGALTKGPKIDAPRIDPPRVDVPRADAPVVDAPAMSMGDAGAGRMEPVRPVTVSDVVSRMETAENRIKAAEVLNDAIDGLVERGEVRLGERSQATVADIQRVAVQEAEITSIQNEAISTAALSDNAGNVDVSPIAARIVSEMPDRLREAIRIDAAQRINPQQPKDLFQIQSVVSETQANAPLLAEANAFVRERAKKYTQARAADLRANSLRSDFLKGPASPRLVTRDSFSVPPQPAMPEGIKTAEAKIDANPKLDADPEQAVIDRAIADAKEEGFDPETGEHDLELDVESLRNQEFLTDEEEQALAAADETFAAVEAWEKAMDVARTCVLK
jgi:hypothetical protein